mmetsp:Transcript_7689/g.16038  ORF Transcript_7689/g.16038 Transcript_7689/m.16038 type:complete len:289 (+) Transcript_7689:75-941(+)
MITRKLIFISAVLPLTTRIETCNAFFYPPSGQTSNGRGNVRLLRPQRTPTSSSTTLTTLNAARPKVEKSDEEWKQILSPEAYTVLRQEGTEPPNTSALNNIKDDDDGTFVCAGCGAPLFTATTKFDSGTGWPSFYSPIDGDAVELDVDYKLVMPRTEVRCNSCGGHLGHVFDDGPRPTGKRYCMNGVAMEFVPTGQDLELAKEVLVRVEESSGNRVQEPIMAVVPGIAFDAVVAFLFISSFVKQNGDGQLLGLAGGIGGVFQLVPLLIGAFYVASALRKLVDLAGLDR